MMPVSKILKQALETPIHVDRESGRYFLIHQDILGQAEVGLELSGHTVTQLTHREELNRVRDLPVELGRRVPLKILSLVVSLLMFPGEIPIERVNRAVHNLVVELEDYPACCDNIR